MAGMSRNLREQKNFMQESFGLIVRSLLERVQLRKNRTRGAANRGAAIVPLSTIGARYGNSVSTLWMPPKPVTKLGLN